MIQTELKWWKCLGTNIFFTLTLSSKSVSFVYICDNDNIFGQFFKHFKTIIQFVAGNGHYGKI